MLRPALLLLVTIATGAHAQKASSAGTRIDPSNVVLLKGKESLSLAHQCSRDDVADVTGTWSPTTRQIKELERLLPAYVADRISQADEPSARRRFQFAGLVSRGRKIIYVNSFVQMLPSDAWKRDAIVVCDGGAVFWGVEFDPETKSFNNMSFNGFPPSIARDHSPSGPHVSGEAF